MILARGSNTWCEHWLREEICLSFPIDGYWNICAEYQQMSVDHGDRTLEHSHAGINLYHVAPGIEIYDFLELSTYRIPFVHERPARWGEMYDGRPREPDRAG